MRREDALFSALLPPEGVEEDWRERVRSRQWARRQMRILRALGRL